MIMWLSRILFVEAHSIHTFPDFQRGSRPPGHPSGSAHVLESPDIEILTSTLDKHELKEIKEKLFLHILVTPTLATTTAY